MDDIKIGALTISIKKEESTTIMMWHGESSERNSAKDLMPFFKKFMKNINKSVILRFNELGYMNSSTIHPLILLLEELNNKKIKTEIHYDKNSPWQKSAFKSIDRLTILLKNIKVVGT